MDYSAQQILAFRIYQDLFSAQPALAQKERQRLLKKWHPDLNPKNQEEATKISKEINAEFEYLFNKLPNKRINKEGVKFESKKEFNINISL